MQNYNNLTLNKQINDKNVNFFVLSLFFKMEDIFISYNWNIKHVVDIFYNKLLASNFRVWRDVTNLKKTDEALTKQLGSFQIN